jgi:CubicO group peptidase (beta-lactamase class C family)
MKPIYFTCLFLSLSFSIHAQYEKLDKAIHKFILMESDATVNAGISIGVIDNDYQKTFTYGQLTKGIDIPPNEHTIYELGACTKIFTATLIAILKEEGKLKYEEDISLYLDKLYLGGKDITILDLLTHYSGMDRFPNNLLTKDKNGVSPYVQYTYQDLLAYLKTYQSTSRAERIYLYSHTNYVLLTLIIEKITQQKYEEVLVQKILKPLKMLNTTFDVPENNRIYIAQGYDSSLKPVDTWNTEVFKGALGLKSTTKDMMIFLEAQLKGGDTELLKIMQNMQNFTLPTNVKNVRTNIGWHKIQPQKKYYSFYAHSGATDGHQVYIAFLRETNTAVVFMSNSKNSDYGMGNSILKILNNRWKRRN